MMDPEHPPAVTLLQGVMTTIASVFAVLLIGFGVWALAAAIYATWKLFRDPQSIAYFARYFLEDTNLAAQLQIGGEGLAHYVAWVAVVLLLLVLGKLGTWAVAAGAQVINTRIRQRP